MSSDYEYYMTSDDGKVKTNGFLGKSEPERAAFVEAKKALKEYKWRDTDVLLSTYPKNGTHFMWEIMNMLLRGTPEYIKESKIMCMIDMYPVSKSDKLFPSPRVLNSHYRLDVLPKEFRGRKTVWVIRNPKDTVISLHKHYSHVAKKRADESEHMKKLSETQFSDYVKAFLYIDDLPYGNYFDYVEYMWTLRDDPNMLIVYFEDLKLDAVREIQRVNEFMGTNRSPGLVQQIADATSFSKMKEGKKSSMDNVGDRIEFMKSVQSDASWLFRKGEIGDWKNHLTVADNELFDSALTKWEGGKDIPFKY